VGTSLKFALNVLKEGGAIAYPTDTVYGIGISISYSENWLEKLSQIKRRPVDKPVSLAFSSVKSVMDFVEGDRFAELLNKFLPGPYTFIMRKSEDFDFPWEKVGVRVPEHETAIKLAESGPVTSTSANLHKKKEAVVWREVNVDVDYILVGKCTHGAPSTVIDLEDGKVIRMGAGREKVKEIMEILDSVAHI